MIESVMKAKPNLFWPIILICLVVWVLHMLTTFAFEYIPNVYHWLNR